MRHAWLGCLLFSSLLPAGTQDFDINVNTRYTVETVIVAGKGWRTDLLAGEPNAKLSVGLRRELTALIGDKLNPAKLDVLAARLKREFGAREVTHRLVRGDSPEHVRVEFDVKPAHGSLDVNVSQFVYDSKQGFSGSGEAGFTVLQNSFAFGLVSDGDNLMERYAGITARYENKRLGTDRVSLRFQFDSFHEQWNSNTIDAVAAHGSDTGGIYRDRQNFLPAVAIVLAKPLTLEIGAGFERFEDEFPAARTEASNAVMTTLRFHQRLEGSNDQQDLDADYALHAATKALDSDFVYTKHTAALRYQFTRGKNVIIDNFWGGAIYGRAPLDDRFVLGNTYYLRGWNKYELDPIGGNRVVHNSVEYRYGPFQVFYDVGAVWEDGQAVIPRHSIGVGVRESGLTLAVAFPVRSGHIEPIFIMGLIP
jgi:hypothetical protein